MHAEQARGPAHVPLDALEHAQHVLPLEPVARLPQRQPVVLGEPRARLRDRDVERHVLQVQHRSRGQHDRAVDDVLQLTHVARPVVAGEHLERARRHAAHVAPAVARRLADEVLHEMRNVLPPLAQRRQAQRDDVQSVKQVFPERALAHRGPQVGIGGREHADVHGDRPLAAHPLDLPLLEHAQELGLQLEAQRADLVQEDRPAVRQLEPAEPSRVGAREGAALVAEQLRLHERLRDGRDVDGDERRVLALAPAVDRARHQLLARAALAGDEHGGGRRRDLRDQLVEARHLGMPAHQPLEPDGGLGAAAGEGRAQRDDLALEVALFQHAVREADDLIHLERLDQVVVRAALERLHRRAHVAHRGGDHHDHRRVERLDARQDVHAGLARHTLVEHDQVDLALRENLQRGGAVLGLEHLARLLEDGADRRPHALLVVHHEDGAATPGGERRGAQQVGAHGRAPLSSTRYWLPPPPPARWT